jgi:hypothetical protein
VTAVPGIWQTLVEFVLRLSFGVAAAMALTPARQVTSGFYRVHLWMLLGFFTLVSLAIASQRALWPGHGSLLLGLAIAAAVVSYVGSVIWIYEARRAGKSALTLVAALSLVAAALAQPLDGGPLAATLATLDIAAGGFLLGAVMSAMLLGHWYLNTPTMDLAPLRKLLMLIAAALVARAAVSGVGLALQLTAVGGAPLSWHLFVLLRWLSGLVLVAILTWMTWQTLKVPNTQSATGILYAALILAFIGELTSQLLSNETAYPV